MNLKRQERRLQDGKTHEDKTNSALVPEPLAAERLMNEVPSEEAGRGDLSDGEKTNNVLGRSF